MKFLWLSWQSGCFCNQMTRAQIQPMAVFITNIYLLLTSFKRRKKEKLKNVTRWLDSVFNFWPFTTTKLCLMVHIILPKYAHVFARNLSQYCQSLFKISMTAPTYLPTYLPTFLLTSSIWANGWKGAKPFKDWWVRFKPNDRYSKIERLKLIETFFDS